MHPVANHLIQLQELVLIRDEQKVAGGEEHLEQLDGSIQEMRAGLPPDVQNHFDKLAKKDHIIIVPVSNSVCAGCGMTLAISHVQAVRLERKIEYCPNCARMLYYPESPPRRIAARARRFGPRKVGVARFSSHTLMIPRLASDDLEGVVRELAYKMEDEGFVDKADKLVERALEREAVISTAVDHGLAFPHVRGVEGGGLTLALGVHPKGINMDSRGKGLTRILFFLVIPTAASAFYLKLLAGLTETFRKPEARKALLAEKDPEKLWKVLVKLTRSTIK